MNGDSCLNALQFAIYNLDCHKSSRENVVPTVLISYRLVNIWATALFISLFVSLLVAPDLIYWLFGLTGNSTANLMSKRAAMLFLGLSVISFQTRNEANSPLRRSLALGLGIIMFGLMFAGIFEFFRGNAGWGIWLAICGEAVFGILYIKLWAKKPD